MGAVVFRQDIPKEKGEWCLSFLIVWTRLSHSSAVIRTSPGNLIPGEAGRMSEYFRNANNRSSRLQEFLDM